MAAPNPRNIMRIDARLVLDPTDVSTDYPYGGTGLASWARVEVRLFTVRAELVAEEWQGIPFETVGGSSRALVAGALREYDEDAISEIWPEYSSEVVARTATDRRGELGSSRAAKLLVAATDSERHPSFLIPLAIPIEEEQIRLVYEIDQEWRLPAVWMGIPDGTGRAWQKGPLWRLTL